MIVFLALIVAIMLVFALRLYKLQVSPEQNELVAQDVDSLTYSTVVEAARGNLLDRNGTVLVSNRVSYNLRIINYVLFNSKGVNDQLLALLKIPLLVQQFHIQYAADVCWSVVIRPHHIRLVPDRVASEIEIAVEMNVSFLLWYKAFSLLSHAYQERE